MARPKKRDPLAEEILDCFSSRKAFQERFIQRYDRNRKAYMGVVERDSKSLDYEYEGGVSTNPPYLNQIVEGVVANLVVDRVKPKVSPYGRMSTPDEIMMVREGARAHEILLGQQSDRIRLTQKQREWILQAEIAGFSPAKVYWCRETKLAWERAFVPYVDMYGEQQLDGEGSPRFSKQERQREQVTYDDPKFEVCDVRDFMYAEGATSIEHSWVIHRWYPTIEELKQLEKDGVYKNVSQLETVGDEQGKDRLRRQAPDEFQRLELELWNEERAKGRVECMEYWYPDGSRYVTLANRRVILADEKNKYWHGRKPFIVLSTAPDLKRIGGVTMIDKVAPIQELLWRFQSQRLTGVELANNPIIITDPSVDEDDLEVFPGANWKVNKDMVTWFVPDPASGRTSLESEELLKREFQDVTGGAPWASGQQESGPSGATATEVSIITTIAQKLIAHRAQFVTWAMEDVYQMMLELNQQFVSKDRVATQIGPDGVPVFESIYADSLPGTYRVSMGAASESMIRQERRAEKISLLQGLLPSAQLIAVISQAKAQAGLPAKTLNVEELVNEVFRAFDYDDIERFWNELQIDPSQIAGQGSQPSPQGSGGNGQTNPALAAGPNSPSNQLSQSPEMMMARMMASRGGTANT